MLSILIPTYDYSALTLVKELYCQCEAAAIVFEIIVLDDASTNIEILNENRKINQISNCIFEQNDTNLGRARNRNKLAKKSKYDWLLFMDCDTFPKNKNFISKYINQIPENEIVFGGIAYHNEKPQKANILRWKYGMEREEINSTKRKLNPYSTALTSNLLIQKEIFNLIMFDNRIIQYGYEDLVFVNELKSRNYFINHIDNATYHLNYETSIAFLEKTKKAIETLLFIEKNNMLIGVETKIQKKYQLISKFKLNKIISFLFTKFQHLLQKNLLSKNPSLFLFDCYKLGYYCSLK